MSTQQIKAFLEAVKADKGLQDKLKSAADADAVAAVAKAAGFVVEASDINAQVDLCEDDLENISGGFGCYVTRDSWPYF